MKRLNHIWSRCVGAGRASEGLREGWRNQLRQAVRECGFEYIRFHGLLHDDMFVYRVIDGEEVFQFQYIDDLFDFLLEIGIRPFVEFGFMPADLASGTQTQFWWKSNVTPPADWVKWENLIERLMNHWVQRYGREEIKTWYYEVWNEPNLHNAFWTGGKQRYFELYKRTVSVVKRVEPGCRVGGPATSNFVPDDRFAGDIEDISKHMTHQVKDLDTLDWQPVWVEEFLEYCQQNSLPVDFVSAHPYPTDFALDGHGETSGRSRHAHSTAEDLKTLRAVVDRSAYRGVPIHLTEWSSSPSSRDHAHDFNPAAAYVAMTNLECAGLAESLSYWTFTDIFEECGAGSRPFHGGFGMINYQGLKKPVYHIYRFLNQLGEQELERGPGYIVTRCEKSGRHAAMLYCYDEEALNGGTVPIAETVENAETVAASGGAKEISFTIQGRPHACYSVETVDAEMGCCMKLYRKLGYPAALTADQRRVLETRTAAHAEILRADKTGRLRVNRMLRPWAVELIKEL